MAANDHLAPLGRVAVLGARLEQLAIAICGLLLDATNSDVGERMCATLGVSQVLERTAALAPLRLADTAPITRWITAANAAIIERNRLMHSAWFPTFDHETQQESLLRSRLHRGVWDVDPEATIDSIDKAANCLMQALATGTHAHIITERALGR